MNFFKKKTDEKTQDSQPSPAPAYQLVSSEFIQKAQAALEGNYQDQFLRLRAEFDNYRKRQAKEREATNRYAAESLICDLLPVLDHFELGMKSVETAQDPKDIVQGLEMVLSQFQKTLEDAGLKSVDATGQTFDPNLHDAVGQELREDVPEGTVLTQHRKGYQLHDRLLRPASVVVAQSPETPVSTE